MSGKVKVRLAHTCNAPEHPGAPGEVIGGVDEALAKSWERKGGGRIVSDETPTAADLAKPAAAKPTAKPAKE